MIHIRKTHLVRLLTAFGITAGLIVLVPHAIAATCATNPDQQSCSTTYGVSETFFGTGGLDTCPTQGANTYCAKQSAGSLTVGNTKGTAYQAQAGFNTDRSPWIEMVVDVYAVNLGTLTSSTTGTGTAQFHVQSYLSSGYVVQTNGASPTNSGHALVTNATPTASTVGVEQFGINLVSNSSVPGSANPVQDPDSTFSFGTVSHNTGNSAIYDVTNQFKYTDGDVIAQSTSSSGTTHYTISYIANISPVTPGGTYTMNQSLVATATF